jgi:RNA polymerase sigma factor (TIGR02999 family)
MDDLSLAPPEAEAPSDADVRSRSDARRHSTEELFPLVYHELRRLAAQKIARESPGHTLQATSLVHEVFLRLGKEPSSRLAERWESRTHFLCAAAEAMRRILVDVARRKRSEKRGGVGRRRVPLETASVTLAVSGSGRPLDVLALDQALAELEQREPDKAQLVKLRFFAGMSLDEAATALDISLATAKRRWTYARAWLYGKLADRDDPPQA